MLIHKTNCICYNSVTGSNALQRENIFDLKKVNKKIDKTSTGTTLHQEHTIIFCILHTSLGEYQNYELWTLEDERVVPH